MCFELFYKLITLGGHAADISGKNRGFADRPCPFLGMICDYLKKQKIKYSSHSIMILSRMLISWTLKSATLFNARQ